MKLWLDDTREAPPGWFWVRTADEAIECLKNGDVHEMSLDHDLGIEAEVKNGYAVLEWLENQVHAGRLRPPEVMKIHTSNSAAAVRMLQAIASIKRLAGRE
jgi:hypothetical protein